MVPSVALCALLVISTLFNPVETGGSQPLRPASKHSSTKVGAVLWVQRLRAGTVQLRGGGGQGDDLAMVDSDSEDAGSAAPKLDDGAMQLGRALWFAAEDGDVEEIDSLVAQGAQVNAIANKKVNGGAPLHWAAKNGHVPAIERLVAHGAKLDLQAPPSNHTALHWAASKDQHGAASRLVQLGATFEARDDMGWTPLHSAAYWGASHTVETLLEMGASVGVQDLEGDTPLHLAAYSGRTQTAMVLLSRGADVEAQNLEGRNAASVATWCNRTETSEALLIHGGMRERALEHGHADFVLRSWVPDGEEEEEEEETAVDPHGGTAPGGQPEAETEAGPERPTEGQALPRVGPGGLASAPPESSVAGDWEAA